MAQRNLGARAAAVERQSQPSKRRLGIDPEETAELARRGRRNADPLRRGAQECTEQADEFTEHAVWDFAGTSEAGSPVDAALPVLRPLPQAGREAGRPRGWRSSSARRRVHGRGEGCTGLRVLRGVDGPGLLALSLHPGGGRGRGRAPRSGLRLFRRGRSPRPRRHPTTTPATASTSPSLAGVWIAAVCGFGGMRDHEGSLGFTPRLPRPLDRLAFRVCYAQADASQVEVGHSEARYRLLEGEPLEVTHHGESLTVTRGDAVAARSQWRRRGPAPSQPEGRAPARRRPTDRGSQPAPGSARRATR